MAREYDGVDVPDATSGDMTDTYGKAARAEVERRGRPDWRGRGDPNATVAPGDSLPPEGTQQTWAD